MNSKLFYLLKQNFNLASTTKKWVKHGCLVPAPPIIKINQILSGIKEHKIENFVETGTFYGDTLEMVARTGIKCQSIELSEELFNFCVNRLKGYKNVKIINDDSAKAIPAVLEGLGEPTFFWLDGHYSGSGTAMGEKKSPVSEEILAIMEHHIKSHVIYIDDARLFNGEEDYPVLADFLASLNKYPDYQYTIACDAIRIVPRQFL